MRIYPDCSIITRTVEVGGLTKSQFIQKLQQYSILMNEYGERLFAADKFTTFDTKYSLKTVELAVMDLGFLMELLLLRSLKERANLVWNCVRLSWDLT